MAIKETDSNVINAQITAVKNQRGVIVQPPPDLAPIAKGLMGFGVQVKDAIDGQQNTEAYANFVNYEKEMHDLEMFYKDESNRNGLSYTDAIKQAEVDTQSKYFGHFNDTQRKSISQNLDSHSLSLYKRASTYGFNETIANDQSNISFIHQTLLNSPDLNMDNVQESQAQISDVMSKSYGYRFTPEGKQEEITREMSQALQFKSLENTASKDPVRVFNSIASGEQADKLSPEQQAQAERIAVRGIVQSVDRKQTQISQNDVVINNLTKDIAESGDPSGNKKNELYALYKQQELLTTTSVVGNMSDENKSKLVLTAQSLGYSPESIAEIQKSVKGSNVAEFQYTKPYVDIQYNTAIAMNTVSTESIATVAEYDRFAANAEQTIIANVPIEQQAEALKTVEQGQALIYSEKVKRLNTLIKSPIEDPYLQNLFANDSRYSPNTVEGIESRMRATQATIETARSAFGVSTIPNLTPSSPILTPAEQKLFAADYHSKNLNDQTVMLANLQSSSGKYFGKILSELNIEPEKALIQYSTTIMATNKNNTVDAKTMGYNNSFLNYMNLSEKEKETVMSVNKANVKQTEIVSSIESLGLSNLTTNMLPYSSWGKIPPSEEQVRQLSAGTGGKHKEIIEGNYEVLSGGSDKFIIGMPVKMSNVNKKQYEHGAEHLVETFRKNVQDSMTRIVNTTSESERASAIAKLKEYGIDAPKERGDIHAIYSIKLVQAKDGNFYMAYKNKQTNISYTQEQLAGFGTNIKSIPKSDLEISAGSPKEKTPTQTVVGWGNYIKGEVSNVVDKVQAEVVNIRDKMVDTFIENKKPKVWDEKQKKYIDTKK